MIMKQTKFKNGSGEKEHTRNQAVKCDTTIPVVYSWTTGPSMLTNNIEQNPISSKISE